MSGGAVVQKEVEQGEEKDDYEYFYDPYGGPDSKLFNKDGCWLVRYMFPELKKLKQIREFKVRESDVYVISFPKSGTTWLQEIVCQIMHHSTGDDKYTGAVGGNIEERVPYLEFTYPGLDGLGARPDPRLIKSHMPFHLLPDELQQGKGKIIYIARNPKDVCVSFYHFAHLMTMLSYTGDLPTFFKHFINGTVGYGPYKEHIERFWDHRNDEHVLFITYEETSRDPRGVVQRISDFMGRAKFTEAQMDEIQKGISFKEMKTNKFTNYKWWGENKMWTVNPEDGDHMRKGEVGDWQNHLTPEMIAEIDKVYTQPLKEKGLVFQE
jgi:hypothetical protein